MVEFRLTAPFWGHSRLLCHRQLLMVKVNNIKNPCLPIFLFAQAKKKEMAVEDIPVANLDLPVSLKVSGGRILCLQT